MKKTLILAAVLLSGCATDPATTKLLVDAQREARNRPTLAVTCPGGGCSVLYHDPRDQANFKMPTNGWDATISISNSLTGIAQGLVVPAAMGYVASQGFKALQGSGGIINNTTTIGANSGTNSGNTTPTTTTTTTIGANSGTNSGNSGKLSGTTLTDQTSTPTVVTQPAPVIVTPTVVNQPTPVIVPPTIVTQPAPVIVTTPAPTPAP